MSIELVNFVSFFLIANLGLTAVRISILQPFVASVDDIEHVHFERVIYGSKNFDMVLIFREGSKDKGEDSFQRITAIPMLCLEGIKSWLTDIAEVVSHFFKHVKFYGSSPACMFPTFCG